MKEEWRPVVGYEGVYEVSNFGNVVRVSSCTGKPCRKPLKKELRKGYRSFTLSMDGTTKHVLAHRETWKAFVGSIPDGMQINHKDGDKDNPHLTNLEVVTPSENKLHSYRELGASKPIPPASGKKGSENLNARLTEQDVINIRRIIASGETQDAVARIYNVNQTQISRIVLRKSWAHI